MKSEMAGFYLGLVPKQGPNTFSKVAFKCLLHNVESSVSSITVSWNIVA